MAVDQFALPVAVAHAVCVDFLQRLGERGLEQFVADLALSLLLRPPVQPRGALRPEPDPAG
jgi:hypothetical protein